MRFGHSARPLSAAPQGCRFLRLASGGAVLSDRASLYGLPCPTSVRPGRGVNSRAPRTAGRRGRPGRRLITASRQIGGACTPSGGRAGTAGGIEACGLFPDGARGGGNPELCPRHLGEGRRKAPERDAPGPSSCGRSDGAEAAAGGGGGGGGRLRLGLAAGGVLGGAHRGVDQKLDSEDQAQRRDQVHQDRVRRAVAGVGDVGVDRRDEPEPAAQLGVVAGGPRDAVAGDQREGADEDDARSLRLGLTFTPPGKMTDRSAEGECPHLTSEAHKVPDKKDKPSTDAGRFN